MGLGVYAMPFLPLEFQQELKAFLKTPSPLASVNVRFECRDISGRYQTLVVNAERQKKLKQLSEAFVLAMKPV